MRGLIPSILTAPGHDPRRVLVDQGLVILCQLPRGLGLVELVLQASPRLVGCVLDSDCLLSSSGVAHVFSFLPPGDGPFDETIIEHRTPAVKDTLYRFTQLIQDKNNKGGHSHGA